MATCLYFIIRFCCFSRCAILSDLSGILVMYLLNSVSSVHYFLSLCHSLLKLVSKCFLSADIFLLSLFFFKSLMITVWYWHAHPQLIPQPSLVHAGSTYRGYFCWLSVGWMCPSKQVSYLGIDLQLWGISLITNPISGVPLRLRPGHMWSQLLLLVP